MNPGKQAATTLLAAILALPACHDSTPVEARSAAATDPGPAFVSSSNGPTFRTKVHDDYAWYSSVSWDEGSTTSFSVSTGSAGTGPDAAAWLSFYFSRCTQVGTEWWEYTCTDFGGWGNIPARDVSGSFGSGISVHTDLRNNPDFWLWGTDPGIVSVRWQRDGWSESRNSGSWEYRFGSYLTRQTGSRRSASARLTGEVLGLPVPAGGWGEVYTGRGVILEFERVTGS